jgi:hypothetical protein
MIFVGITAARPANHGWLEVAKCLENVRSEAIAIRDIRIRANPDAVVNGTTEMFEKVPI